MAVHTQAGSALRVDRGEVSADAAPTTPAADVRKVSSRPIERDSNALASTSVAEAELIARARNRDQAAFGALVTTHQRAVRGYLLRLCKGNHANADDLAQNTFLAAWRGIDRFRADGHIEAWLMRIATNEFRMAWRKRGPDTREVDPDAVELGVHDPDTSDLDKLLSLLDPAAQAALVLNSGHGYSHREIAEVLEMPLGTVKSLIHRAKLDLRARLNRSEPVRS